MSISTFLAKVAQFLRRGQSVDDFRRRGAVIGDNCHIYGSIDHGHEYLVTIGNNVTVASGARLLTHDGSTKKILGYSKVGRIDIGDDVFIGAASIVLPNVKIGNRVIVGAGSVVTKDIPDNSVAVGNPARVIGTYDNFVAKNQALFEITPHQDTHYSVKTKEEKQSMKDALLESGYGFDI